MQLTGDLSDFALTDILQILSLSRKTGIVSLQGAGWEGNIVVEGGRITHASANPGDSLADTLALAGLLAPGALRTLTSGGDRADGRLERLLVESGILTRQGLAAAARHHTQRIIGKLVALEKGRFSIALGDATLPEPVDGLRLADGLDVGEALLNAAHERDESDRQERPDAKTEAQGLLSLDGGRETQPLANRSDTRELLGTTEASVAEPSKSENRDRSMLLCSLLAEMRQNSFDAEVSLLIMRYASELATRGILFAVRDSKLWGLGQFGLKQDNGRRSADELVRELCLPLDSDSLFARVVRTGEPFIGVMPESYWVAELLSRVGGFGHRLTSFLLPVICHDKPAFIIYGDNYPGNSALEGMGELVALASQASLVLERIALKRRVLQLESGNLR